LFSLQVYSDLEVAFTISEDAAVYKALSQTIELLEGHTSVISQHYYGCLFHELLAFQIGDRHPPQEVNMTGLFQFSTLLVLPEVAKWPVLVDTSVTISQLVVQFLISSILVGYLDNTTMSS
jgi:hypothetical protein